MNIKQWSHRNKLTKLTEKDIAEIPPFDPEEAKKFDLEQEELCRSYDNVKAMEIFSLDMSIIRWLRPRLQLLKEAWEKHIVIDTGIQKKQYQAICELINLSTYILEDKWYEEVADPEPDDKPFDWDDPLKFIPTEDGGHMMINEEHLEEMLKTETDPLKIARIEARLISLKNKSVYYEKLSNLEWAAKEKYVKLLSKYFYALWW